MTDNNADFEAERAWQEFQRQQEVCQQHLSSTFEDEQEEFSCVDDDQAELAWRQFQEEEKVRQALQNDNQEGFEITEKAEERSILKKEVESYETRIVPESTWLEDNKENMMNKQNTVDKEMTVEKRSKLSTQAAALEVSPIEEDCQEKVSSDGVKTDDNNGNLGYIDDSNRQFVKSKSEDRISYQNEISATPPAGTKLSPTRLELHDQSGLQKDPSFAECCCWYITAFTLGCLLEWGISFNSVAITPLLQLPFTCLVTFVSTAYAMVILHH